MPAEIAGEHHREFMAHAIRIRMLRNKARDETDQRLINLASWQMRIGLPPDICL